MEKPQRFNYKVRRFILECSELYQRMNANKDKQYGKCQQNRDAWRNDRIKLDQ